MSPNVMVTLFATLAFLSACGDGRELDPTDDGGGGDGGARCQGAGQAGTIHTLPSGRYSGTFKAVDATKCGLTSMPKASDVKVTVQVTNEAITVEPGKPTAVRITRSGNTLCGSSTRLYEYIHNGQTCILDEADTISGAVTGKGAFWVDLDFDWTRRGGVCSVMTLPCSGRFTWSFELSGHDLRPGAYQAKVTQIKEDSCAKYTGSEGQTYSDYKISATSGELSFCYKGGSCLTFKRWGDTLDHSGDFSWSSPTCPGTETISGEITSSTSFRLTRTRETAPSCGSSCRAVLVMDFSWFSCPLGQECCDGKDNDADGQIDEDNVCAGEAP